MTIQQSGANVVLTWLQGTLLKANDVTGPWTNNNEVSPLTTATTGTQKFFRLKVM